MAASRPLRLWRALWLLVGVGGAVGVGIIAFVASAPGRDWLTRRVEAGINSALSPKSTVAIHGLRVFPLGTVRLDSIVWRDAAAVPVVQVGSVALRISLLPLRTRELRIVELQVRRPRVQLTQDSTGAWNLAGMLPAPSPSAGPMPAWHLRIDAASVVDGTVRVTRPDSLPSHPPLHTTINDITLGVRDVAYETETGHGAVDITRIALAADTPSIHLRDLAGRVDVTPARLTLDVPRILLGDSRVALDGAVALADSASPRFALTLRADSVALADIAWASAMIPRTGTAKGTVRITDGGAPGSVQLTVTDLVVRAFDSDVRGALRADVGEMLALRDVDLRFAPLDFRLLRATLGDTVPPAPWDGRIRGRLRAPGGPLSRWHLSPSSFVFEDRRVGAARSRLTVAGTLDLESVQTRLLPLTVRLDSLDVRTLGGVTDIADSLRGYLTGQVWLAGPLDDLRFSELDLVHIDGSLPRSHVRGAGRIAEDTTRQWLEAQLQLDTVSVAALGHPFTSETLGGTLAGTLDVRATGDSVTMALALSGPSGALDFAGVTSLDTTRLQLMGDLYVRELDLRPLLPALALPEHRLTASAQLGLDGTWDAPSGPIAFAIDTSSSLAGIHLDEGRGTIALEPGGVRVDTLLLRGPIGSASARGRLSRDPALRDTLRFAARLDAARELAGFLSDSLAAAWRDSIAGTMRIDGVALGSFDTLDVSAILSAASLRAGAFGVRQLEAEVFLQGLPAATQGFVTFDIADIAGLGVPIHRVSSETTIRDATWGDASMRVVAGDTLRITARADVQYMGDSIAIRLDSLDATSRGAPWRLTQPGSAFRSPDRIVVDDFEMRSTAGGRISLGGRWREGAALAVRATAERVPLADAGFTGFLPAGLTGLFSLDATVTGTSDDPRITVRTGLDSVRVADVLAPSVDIETTYADRMATVTARSRFADREALTMNAELPLDLAFIGKPLAARLLEDSLYVRVVAEGAPLDGLQAVMPAVRDLRGGYDAELQVTGTWTSLEPRGSLLVRDGGFVVPALGTGFQEFDMDVGFTPESIVVYRARIADGRSQRDTAHVAGSIFRERKRWNADLTTTARALRVIDDPRLAEADVSWNLRMRGPLDSLRLGGEIFVPNANVIIGRQSRRVLELREEGDAAASGSTYAPVLENLRLRLGNEVRLRSPEASVQLTGDVAVTGTLDAPDVRGEIYASRGSYRLDLGLLQRTFQVDSGFVRLNGPLSIPPTLDIRASYVVRQAERDDVHIAARIAGTVDQPSLSLSSTDLGTTASDTEIISYLLFGAPTFALDRENSSAVRLAASALVPALGGAAERALGARLPFLSELQVVTLPGDTPQNFTLNSFEGLLNRYAIQAGTQLGSDSYLRLSAGVCRGENRAAQSLPAWFGLTGEYRPVERLSAELSLTPGSSPCNRIGTFSQIYQLGLDLYRDWRW